MKTVSRLLLRVGVPFAVIGQVLRTLIRRSGPSAFSLQQSGLPDFEDTEPAVHGRLVAQAERSRARGAIETSS